MFVFLLVTNIVGQSFIVPIAVTPQSEFGFMNKFSVTPSLQKQDEDHVSGCYRTVCTA